MKKHDTFALVQPALDAVAGTNDDQAWNDFCQAWIDSKIPIPCGVGASEMAARVLAAEVLRLRTSQSDTVAALSGEIKAAQLRAAKAERRVQWYVDRDSLKAGNA